MSGNIKLGCLRCTKFCWVGKHINIIIKPTNSPTQGQPNPRKIRLIVAFGPLFPTANIFFRGLGLVLYSKTKLKETWPNRILRKHPISLFYQYEYIGVLAENLVGLGFLQSVSHNKTNPNKRKIICCGEKAQNATFNLNFPWVGLALGWGVRRFHNNIQMFSIPT